MDAARGREEASRHHALLNRGQRANAASTKQADTSSWHSAAMSSRLQAVASLPVQASMADMAAPQAASWRRVARFARAASRPFLARAVIMSAPSGLA